MERNNNRNNNRDKSPRGRLAGDQSARVAVISRMLTKLGAKSRVEIARAALRQGISPWQRPAGVIAAKVTSHADWSSPGLRGFMFLRTFTPLFI
jgi:hypothetical protein